MYQPSAHEQALTQRTVVEAFRQGMAVDAPPCAFVSPVARPDHAISRTGGGANPERVSQATSLSRTSVSGHPSKPDKPDQVSRRKTNVGSATAREPVRAPARAAHYNLEQLSGAIGGSTARLHETADTPPPTQRPDSKRGARAGENAEEGRTGELYGGPLACPPVATPPLFSLPDAFYNKRSSALQRCTLSDAAHHHHRCRAAPWGTSTRPCLRSVALPPPSASPSSLSIRRATAACPSARASGRRRWCGACHRIKSVSAAPPRGPPTRPTPNLTPTPRALRADGVVRAKLRKIVRRRSR